MEEDDLWNGVTKLLFEAALCKGQHAQINLMSSCGCGSTDRLGQMPLLFLSVKAVFRFLC